MSYKIGVKYFNCFLLKKVIPAPPSPDPVPLPPQWPGLPWFRANNSLGYPAYPFASSLSPNTPGSFKNLNNNMYFVEESRIKGGFNNANITNGVRAYVVNESLDSTDKKHSLIYSGLLNTRTSFIETNVFSIADPLVRDLDPLNGSIQKLFAEDSNLMVLQENKISKVLVNKNAIYSGEQGSLETGGEVNVLGQDVPYLGEYGISRNPESFAFYGYRKYFADKDRAAILRLSRDGITEISGYGMKDYFRDNLSLISDTYQRQVYTGVINTGLTTGVRTEARILSGGAGTLAGGISGVDIGSLMELVKADGTVVATNSRVTSFETDFAIGQDFNFFPAIDFGAGGIYNKINFVTFKRGQILGGWDAHQSSYTVSLQNIPRSIATPVTPLNSPGGNFDTLGFDEGVNGWTSFYSYKPNLFGSLKNNFFTFINSEIYQHYDEITPNNRTKFYGASQPADAFVEFIFNPSPTVVKNFNTIGYEGSNGWEVDTYLSDLEGFDDINGTGIYSEFQDSTKSIKSYVEGAYDSSNPPLTGVVALDPTATQPIFRVGFNRKENHYVANLINNSFVRPGEIIGGIKMSGVKGYIMTVKLSIDASTDSGGTKQLFSVSSNYVLSSMP